MQLFWHRDEQEIGSIIFLVLGDTQATSLRLLYTIGAKQGHPEDFDLYSKPINYILAWVAVDIGLSAHWQVAGVEWMFVPSTKRKIFRVPALLQLDI